MAIIANGDVVSIQALKDQVRELSLSTGLTENVQKLVIDQISQLEAIYGQYVDRGVAARILQTQIEMTRTGYFQEPVDIVEFVESQQYMNQKKFIRPKLLEHLVRLWQDPHKYIEVVLGGSIGYGKNYFLDMSMGYFIYRMSCLYSPQAHFGLAPGSDIVFLFQSKTYDSARKVIFNQFKQRIEASTYFSENFMFEARASASELKFPNHIRIRPVSSSDTAALSLNVLAACFPAKQEYLLADGTLRRVDIADKCDEKILTIDEANRMMNVSFRGNGYTGIKEVYRLHFDNGDSIDCSPEQKFTEIGGIDTEAQYAEGKKFKYFRMPDMRSAGYVSNKTFETSTSDVQSGLFRKVSGSETIFKEFKNNPK